MKPGESVASRYTVEGVLGQGGMGSVFVARDEKFGERIALKVATASGSTYEEFKARFVREARLGSRLGKAEGFVRAFDWGELPGSTLYLAMDLVEGAGPLDLATGTLLEKLARLKEAARLVALAHRKGVIHRDLKPANFLQGGDGTLWLADFGLAKVLGETDVLGEALERTAGLTRTGAAMGTPAFMPPEQFEDAKHSDERADVYALGVMLFLALTGRVPFEGSPTAIMQRQTKVSLGAEPLPRPRMWKPEVPEVLDALCARAIALEPGARLASAQALVAGIDAFLEPQGAPTEPTVLDRTVTGARIGSPTTPPPAAPRARRSPVGIVLCLVALALAGGTALHRYWGTLVQALPEAVWRRAPATTGSPPAVVPPAGPASPLPMPDGAKLPDRLRAGVRVPLPSGKEVQVYLWNLPANAGDMELVWVPAGDFLYGDDKAKTPMDHGYWIGRNDVTWKQYRAFCKAEGRTEPADPRFGAKDDHPVVNVSWDESKAYCEWAGLALPTEKEWEKAARGDDGRAYPWGNDAPTTERCVFDQDDSTGTGPATAGSCPEGASPCGALDMAGNVWQWCEDLEGPYRADRGGHWCDSAFGCRSSNRSWGAPSLRADYLGFRCLSRSSR